MTYKKDCDCKGTSTMGQARIREADEHTPETLTFKASLYAMPICDVCGKPWARVEDNRVHGVLTDVEEIC